MRACVRACVCVCVCVSWVQAGMLCGVSDNWGTRCYASEMGVVGCKPLGSKIRG